MKIAFSTDEVTDVTDHLCRVLSDRGHEVVAGGMGDAWPAVGHRVGAAVASGEADLGIVCCWTGTGVALAANKVPGVRAALCTDAETARGARRWNDATVLAIGLRLTSATVATEIVEAFLTTDVDPDEVETIATVEAMDASPAGTVEAMDASPAGTVEATDRT